MVPQILCPYDRDPQKGIHKFGKRLNSWLLILHGRGGMPISIAAQELLYPASQMQAYWGDKAGCMSGGFKIAGLSFM